MGNHNEKEKNPEGERLPYEAPRIVHEETVQSVAVACDPSANPFLPVKSVDGAPNGAGGFCQNGFLNS